MQLGARNWNVPTNRTHSSFDIEFPTPQTNKKEISIQSLVIFLGYHKQDKMYFCFLTILNWCIEDYQEEFATFLHLPEWSSFKTHCDWRGTLSFYTRKNQFPLQSSFMRILPPSLFTSVAKKCPFGKLPTVLKSCLRLSERFQVSHKAVPTYCPRKIPKLCNLYSVSPLREFLSYKIWNLVVPKVEQVF